MLEISLSSLGAWFLTWAIFWFLVIFCSTFVVVVNVRGPRDIRPVSWAFFGSLLSFAVAVAPAAAVADSGDGDGGVAAAVATAAAAVYSG